tara:strand:+ start:7411 stop:7536 length:126 start_codon:yes stop_codon:yes gene_type:complete
MIDVMVSCESIIKPFIGVSSKNYYLKAKGYHQQIRKQNKFI